MLDSFNKKQMYDDVIAREENVFENLEQY